MYDQSIVLQKMYVTKYCITKVNKDVWPKVYNVLYYKSKQRCITKVLYYKSKQRCYDQSIVLQT